MFLYAFLLLYKLKTYAAVIVAVTLYYQFCDSSVLSIEKESVFIRLGQRMWQSCFWYKILIDAMYEILDFPIFSCCLS